MKTTRDESKTDSYVEEEKSRNVVKKNKQENEENKNDLTSEMSVKDKQKVEKKGSEVEDSAMKIKAKELDEKFSEDTNELSDDELKAKFRRNIMKHKAYLRQKKLEEELEAEKAKQTMQEGNENEYNLEITN